MYNIIAKSLAVGILACTSLALADSPAEPTPSLYERLGGWDGIDKVVHDTIAYHQNNPAIAHYFAESDIEKLAAHVTAFFAAGTGGPAMYEGRDMTSAHATMGLTNTDFDQAVADVLKAIDANGIGATEKAEVAAILESLRPAVMGTAGS